jgi:hypothetical protein
MASYLHLLGGVAQGFSEPIIMCGKRNIRPGELFLLPVCHHDQFIPRLAVMSRSPIQGANALLEKKRGRSSFSRGEECD